MDAEMPILHTHVCTALYEDVLCVYRGCVCSLEPQVHGVFVPSKLSLSRALALARARALSIYNSASGNKRSRLDSQFHQSLILEERFRRTLLPSSARGMGPA